MSPARESINTQKQHSVHLHWGSNCGNLLLPISFTCNCVIQHTCSNNSQQTPTRGKSIPKIVNHSRHQNVSFITTLPKSKPRGKRHIAKTLQTRPTFFLDSSTLSIHSLAMSAFSATKYSTLLGEWMAKQYSVSVFPGQLIAACSSPRATTFIQF